jgi:hypothetical protein
LEIIKRKLKQRHGNILVDSAIVVLIGMMFLAVIMETAQTYLTINMLKGKTNAAVLSVAATNVANIYDGVRESTGNARAVSSGNWSELVTTEDVENALVSTLSLTPSGQVYDRITSQKAVAYRISNLNTAYINSNGSNLNFKTTLTVTIPLHFLGLKINQNMEVETTYDARF